MSFVKSLEQIISVFLDKIISTQGVWKSKSDLVQLWNAGFINGVVTSRIIIKENSKKEEAKKEEFKKEEAKKEDVCKKETNQIESKEEYKRCIFIITRGEKLGDQCTARAKHDSFCVKHYKDPKQRKEEPLKSVSKPDQEENTESVMEFSISNIKKINEHKVSKESTNKIDEIDE